MPAVASSSRSASRRESFFETRFQYSPADAGESFVPPTAWRVAWNPRSGTMSYRVLDMRDDMPSFRERHGTPYQASIFLMCQTGDAKGWQHVL